MPDRGQKNTFRSSKAGLWSLLGLFFMLAWTISCAAEIEPSESARPIVLGFVNFPPASYLDDADQPAGFLLELGQRVLKKAGYESETRHYPANRLAAFLGTGDVDLFLGIATLPGIENAVLAGASTIASIELRVYGLNEAQQVRVWEDLRGKTVIVIRGYSYGGWISKIREPANGITMLEVADHDQALKVLKLGRGDILLDYAGPVEEALTAMDIPDLQSSLISVLDCKFIVSKKTPQATRLLNDLEAAFRSLNEIKRVF